MTLWRGRVRPGHSSESPRWTWGTAGAWKCWWLTGGPPCHPWEADGRGPRSLALWSLAEKKRCIWEQRSVQWCFNWRLILSRYPPTPPLAKNSCLLWMPTTLMRVVGVNQGIKPVSCKTKTMSWKTQKLPMELFRKQWLSVDFLTQATPFTLRSRLMH